MIIPFTDLQQEYLSLKSRQSEFIHATGSHPSLMLILLTPTIDSICAARILTAILKSDLIQFVIKPVKDYEELLEVAQEYLKDENLISIFLINCGGTIALLEALSPESRVTLYILDSHRPYHLSNVHSQQIKIFHDSMDGEEMVYPMWNGGDSDDEDGEGEEMKDIGPGGGRGDDEDDESDEEDDEDDIEFEDDDSVREDGSEGLSSDGSPSTKRRKRSSADVELLRRQKREAKAARKAARQQRREQDRDTRRQSLLGERTQRRIQRERDRNRHELELAKYYDGTTYGMSSSLLMYNLSANLNKSSNYELWLSMIGLSATFLEEQLDQAKYQSVRTYLSSELTKYNTSREELEKEVQDRSLRAGSNALDALVLPVGHISDTSIFRFSLLTHSSLYGALKYSSYTGIRLQTWTQQGKDYLRHLLTGLGIRTQDAKSSYKTLKTSELIRVEERLEEEALEKFPDRFRTGQEGEMKFDGFVRQLTPTLAVDSIDVVLALQALLELPQDEGLKFAEKAIATASMSNGGSTNTNAAVASASSSSSSSSTSAATSSLSTSSSSSTHTWSTSFWRAWRSLEGGISSISDGAPLILHGLNQSVYLQHLIYQQATYIIQQPKAIRSEGSFRWVKVSDYSYSSLTTAHLFCKPSILARLGYFLYDYSVVGGISNSGEQHQSIRKPLLLCAPIPGRGAHVIVAIVGMNSLHGMVGMKNLFGTRFSIAADPPLPEREEEEMDDPETEEERRERLIAQGEEGAQYARIRVKQTGFDSACVEVQNEDLELFMSRV